MSDYHNHGDDGGRFQMLYCDLVSCRVNTFERGDSGECPGCGEPGEVLR